MVPHSRRGKLRLNVRCSAELASAEKVSEDCNAFRKYEICEVTFFGRSTSENHMLRRIKAEVEHAVRKAGFRAERCEKFNHFVVPEEKKER
jgi:hypothetical protein